MSIRIAINGFGRIGRNIVRAIYERNLQDKIDAKFMFIVTVKDVKAGNELTANLAVRWECSALREHLDDINNCNLVYQLLYPHESPHLQT